MNPNGALPNHGVPAAAVPGEAGPLVPGAPRPALASVRLELRTIPVPDTVIAPTDQEELQLMSIRNLSLGKVSWTLGGRSARLR